MNNLLLLRKDRKFSGCWFLTVSSEHTPRRFVLSRSNRIHSAILMQDINSTLTGGARRKSPEIQRFATIEVDTFRCLG